MTFLTLCRDNPAPLHSPLAPNGDLMWWLSASVQILRNIRNLQQTCWVTRCLFDSAPCSEVAALWSEFWKYPLNIPGQISRASRSQQLELIRAFCLFFSCLASPIGIITWHQLHIIPHPTLTLPGLRPAADWQFSPCNGVWPLNPRSFIKEREKLHIIPQPALTLPRPPPSRWLTIFAL